MTENTARYQYRITVNGTQGKVLDLYPDDQWHHIADVVEERGAMLATLERRLITRYEPGDEDLYPGSKLGNLYVSRWDVLAELEN